LQEFGFLWGIEMNIQELIKKLQTYPPDTAVMSSLVGKNDATPVEEDFKFYKESKFLILFHEGV